jgi:hypothetical protein
MQGVGAPSPPKTPPKGLPVEEEEEGRPTLVPDFDPGAFARDSEEEQCLSAIGSEAAILVVAVSDEELKSCALDNVSGFIVSLLDGATSVENILDICGLPRLLALRHLRSLLERGVVALGSRTRVR